MVKLGILNSRMKDFFDIWLMARQFDFDGTTLAEAITKTFSTRGTSIQADPVGLTNTFGGNTEKAAQWRGFVRKNRLADVPQNLVEVVAAIAAFLGPVQKIWQRASLSKGPGRHRVHGFNRLLSRQPGRHQDHGY